MCVFSSPKVPAPPPPPPPPPEPPTKAAEPVRRARQEQITKQRAAAGANSTFLTGARGLLAPESTGKTTLLGG